jgi:hypothetical protein
MLTTKNVAGFCVPGSDPFLLQDCSVRKIQDSKRNEGAKLGRTRDF